MLEDHGSTVREAYLGSKDHGTFNCASEIARGCCRRITSFDSQAHVQFTIISKSSIDLSSEMRELTVCHLPGCHEKGLVATQRTNFDKFGPPSKQSTHMRK